MTSEEICSILKRAIEDKEKGLSSIRPVEVEEKAIEWLAEYASGDARIAINVLENTMDMIKGSRIELSAVQETMQKKALVYDKTGEEHYNIISAFIKSMRGSDPDAALYWLARMLESGEDPLFIARRMIIFASEDIGNADPQAILVAVAAKDAFHFLGEAEGWIPLAQAVTYLSTAPKSNASYMAYKGAKKAVLEKGPLPVPLHLRNAPTHLLKDLNYGRDYQYPHNYPGGFVSQQYLPDKLIKSRFYFPSERGFEAKISALLKRIRRVMDKKEGT